MIWNRLKRKENKYDRPTAIPVVNPYSTTVTVEWDIVRNGQKLQIKHGILSSYRRGNTLEPFGSLIIICVCVACQLANGTYCVFPMFVFRHLNDVYRFIAVQIDIPKDQQYLLTEGGLPGIYQMDQMHFHWASEHTIDSKRYDLCTIFGRRRGKAMFFYNFCCCFFLQVCWNDFVFDFFFLIRY